MKLSRLALLAGLAVGVVTAPALADQVVVNRTTTTTTHVVDHHPAWHRHKVCRTTWYHHRRVTRCRWR